MRHFTLVKGTFGWEVYNGTADERGERTTHNSFTHSDDAYDYCTKLGEATNEPVALHFDCRGL
jgi:hypothetical protein